MEMNTYKLLVLGGYRVGKSSLTTRFVSNQIQQKYDPDTEHSYSKQTLVDSESCLVYIFAPCITEELFQMRDSYISDAQGFLCVYDITARWTFEGVAHTYEHILRVKDVDHAAVVVVGNKCDLAPQRQVSAAEGAALAQSLGGCVFLETSAKDDINVSECFFAAVRAIRRLNDAKKTTKDSTRCYLS